MKQPDQAMFDLGHDIKLSFKMGEIVPTAVFEVLPGDSFTIDTQNMLRFAPMYAPVMHRIKVKTNFFFVPNRILWSEWEDWITGNVDSQHPFVRLDAGTEIAIGSLADYMGFPAGLTSQEDINVNPLAIGAYLKIWDEYYRDQNLQTEQFEPFTEGENDVYGFWFENAPLRRAWARDYFTSALPSAQKGDAVQVPLTFASDIPVTFNPLGGSPTAVPTIRNAGTGVSVPNAEFETDSAGEWQNTTPVTENIGLDPAGTLVVDVQSDAVDINTLRRAFRLQEWLEKNARGGTRYAESMMAHFGVPTSDARLQRPEYIGGSVQNMVISEVLATAETTAADVVVGNMSGHGISVGNSGKMRYRAEEHGWIIGVITVMPETAYQDGIPRQFTRLDRLDIAWPTFAALGEQPILQKEINYAADNPNGTFGYTPRYSEYKFLNNRVAGEFRDTLDYWHLGRKFSDGDIPLNQDFIECLPTNRIFNVIDDTVDHIYAHVMNNVMALRKLPRFGIPTI